MILDVEKQTQKYVSQFREPKIPALSKQPKLYISSTLNIDLILWHTQLIVCAVKCQIMVYIMGYFFHFSRL